MSTKIFVNLPVNDLPKTIEFWTALGFKFNPQFTDDKAACMVVNEHIYAMFLTKPFFLSFMNKQINDTSSTAEVITALSADSRQEVDDLVAKAISAGGKSYHEKTDVEGMYSLNFQDLDGHLWEVFWMDPASIKPLP